MLLARALACSIRRVLILDETASGSTWVRVKAAHRRSVGDHGGLEVPWSQPGHTSQIEETSPRA